MDQILAENDDIDNISKIKITSYEPAFSIIGDPAKRNPETRQSADHSMAYIVSSVMRKAFHKYDKWNLKEHDELNELWK